jgi:hypothetical protein
LSTISTEARTQREPRTQSAEAQRIGITTKDTMDTKEKKKIGLIFVSFVSFVVIPFGSVR